MTTFALNNLAVFERPNAKVSRARTLAGARVVFDNGWTVSIQWGPGTYSSNHDDIIMWDREGPVRDAVTAECAVWKGDGGFLAWQHGDTVGGWCTMAGVQRLLDWCAADDVPVPVPELLDAPVSPGPSA